MLGISFLEEIVNLKGITDTADICNELREMVVRALRQKGEREEAKDGMDISICSYDKKQNVVEFTGANNNIYLIRNNELIEYRADRLPIGFSDELDKPYSRQLIKIVPGDIIYMFSDGFADQFGGPDNKRYKYSGLKAILLQVSNKPLDEQKTLLENEFSSWKEERQQTDDILIIGFKP
jgi:sigma-B regulation protein RsbU (phosphoserine phosphatase)